MLGNQWLSIHLHAYTLWHTYQMEVVSLMYSSQADLWKSLYLLCAHTAAPLLLLVFWTIRVTVFTLHVLCRENRRSIFNKSLKLLYHNYIFVYCSCVGCRSQWPRGLTRGSAAGRLLGMRVRIPPGSWMSVCCECCVLSGGGLCDGLITRPEESYQVWCVGVWSWSLNIEEALAH